MAKKLKNLKITSVSVVDEGANPRANIVFTKSKNPAPAAAPEAGKESEKTDNLFKRFVNWLSGEGGMTSEEVQKQATTFARGNQRRDLGRDLRSAKFAVIHSY